MNSGKGEGVAIDNKTKTETFMKMVWVFVAAKGTK
jgi:hypothetical protein